MVESEVVERSVGIGGYVERAFSAGSFDVPDMDVAEVRQTLRSGTLVVSVTQ